MKNISKTAIQENLKSLDRLFNSSTSGKKALFYSKLAILELCGWIEETMDKIIFSCAARNLKDQNNRQFIDDQVIKRTYGFNYNDSFRRMLILAMGLRGVEMVERSMDQGALQVLRSTLGLLKKSRDEEVHTHLQGRTRRLDAPSVTIQKFERVYEALTTLERAMKKSGF
jgi:hypothetical protein